MKTDDLVTLLASGVTPVQSHAGPRRIGLALGPGLLLAGAVMLAVLGLRPDLATAATLPMFWVKLGFPLALAAAGFLAAERLSRPGARLGRLLGWGVALPVLLLCLLAAWVLWQAAPADRLPLVLGQTWRNCGLNILMVSTPVFIAQVWALRGLAPTRLRLAGAGVGLLSGAVGAAVYALHCPEMDAPFLGVWYLLGIAAVAGIGALLGPRLLRW